MVPGLFLVSLVSGDWSFFASAGIGPIFLGGLKKFEPLMSATKRELAFVLGTAQWSFGEKIGDLIGWLCALRWPLL
jgi:hypothetical protein